MIDVKKLDWNENLIKSYWDGISKTAMDRVSFGKAAGPELIKICRKYIPENATILDFGSGSGDFLNILIKESFNCSSYDISQERSELLKQSLINKVNYLGAISDDDNKSFDVVFCNEVIEHIPETKLDSFTDKLVTLVAPNGLLILTTPNNENLDDSLCLCANCMHTFHRWQHLNTFTIEQISEKFENRGFKTEDYFLTDFSSNAQALTAWRELKKCNTKVIESDNNCSNSRWIGLLKNKIQLLRSSIRCRINIAKKAWELILKPEEIMPNPRELYGSGSALIYIGRKISS
jgi:2-polyprenyl-3-methyl-5-hydroxy-6-metoxy-1,4-benzoquinol methylase